MNDKKIKERYMKLHRLLSMADNAIFKARKAELNKFNITPGQAAVLTYIQKFGDRATIKSISKHLFREVHSVSEQITRMEKRGLLKKGRNNSGGSFITFEITKKGIEALSFARQTESLGIIMSVLSEQECDQLTSSLEKLLSKAEELY